MSGRLSGHPAVTHNSALNRVVKMSLIVWVLLVVGALLIAANVARHGRERVGPAQFAASVARGGGAIAEV